MIVDAATMATTGHEEAIDVLIIETSAPFDHRFCQGRQSGKRFVFRQTTLADGPNVRFIDPILERQSRME
jgi:hypothetical protein